MILSPNLKVEPTKTNGFQYISVNYTESVLKKKE